MLPYLEDVHPMSGWLVHKNLVRQYDYMNSSFVIWSLHGKPPITAAFIKDLNFYAAHHLSPYPGTLRGDQNTYDVAISNSPHVPPSHQHVGQLMDEFIARVDTLTQTREPSYTAAYILWRLNWIHPFAQGNGRTARAACYFYICQQYDTWLPGTTPLHELIRRERDAYCALLVEADKNADNDGMTNLDNMQLFLEKLLFEQISSATSVTPPQ